LIEGWHATRFSRVLSVEHATHHVLPAGGSSVAFGDTSITTYR
jgi:hypothetical protein